MPRNRRPKSRLMGGMSDDQRVDLRQKALDMAAKGLGPAKGVARRGPVHEGSPAAQRASAERMSGEKRIKRNEDLKSRVSLRGNDRPVRVREIGQMRTNTNAGSPRQGRKFTTLRIGGKTVHQYENGPDIVVGNRRPRESGGTGNNVKPRSGGDLQSLALQRAKAGSGNSSRKFLSTGARDPGGPSKTYRKLRPLRGIGRKRMRSA